MYPRTGPMFNYIILCLNTTQPPVLWQVHGVSTYMYAHTLRLGLGGLAYTQTRSLTCSPCNRLCNDLLIRNSSGKTLAYN